MRKILEQCPTCNNNLLITELSCSVCDTRIHGQYAPCLFCRLSAEDLAFLELFVKKRGNVKEMERDLGISYWSIRNRLDEVVERIGFEAPIAPQKQEARAQRREILEQLDRGEITVGEAAQQLSRSER